LSLPLLEALICELWSEYRDRELFIADDTLPTKLVNISTVRLDVQ